MRRIMMFLEDRFENPRNVIIPGILIVAILAGYLTANWFRERVECVETRTFIAMGLTGNYESTRCIEWRRVE